MSHKMLNSIVGYFNSQLATLKARQNISSHVDEISHTLVSVMLNATAAGSIGQKTYEKLNLN